MIAINGSPQSGWKTDILVREEVAGAEAEGAETEIVDFYKLDKFKVLLLWLQNRGSSGQMCL